VGETECARLREALLSYARSHPNASDTESGIAGWWLPADLQFSMADFGRVLGELVADGVLQVTRLPDGSDLYSVTHSGADPT
jgi:hypothetical protein